MPFEREYGGIYIDVQKSVEVVLTLRGEGGIIKPELRVEIPEENKNNVGINNYVHNVKKMLRATFAKDEKGNFSGIDILLGKLKVGEIKDYQVFGQLDIKTGEYTTKSLLTTSEMRFLSQSNIQEIEKLNIPFDRNVTKSPKTDLHTHLSGALTIEDMLKIGSKFNVYIPLSSLSKAGVDIEKYNDKKVVRGGKEFVRFLDLESQDVKIYSKNLSIKPQAQETFTDMENCYVFRDPFVKLKKDFLDESVNIEEVLYEQLKCLAEHYTATGIKYAELCMSEICKDSAMYVECLDKVMPKIEREYPDVCMRFLGGIPRSLPTKIQKNRGEYLFASAKSEYITGLDIMGHEINETKYFEEVIHDSLVYSTTVDKNFVIRVHAGESDVHINNVKQFLQIVDKYLTEHPKTNIPIIRIGHGIHGLDGETIRLCKKLGAIIEINASSNFALNNIDSLDELGTKRYIDAGIQVVLGTDGHGMYSTDSRQEAILAAASGVTEQDLEKINDFEQRYIDRMQESIRQKSERSIIEKRGHLKEVVEKIRNAMQRITASGNNKELAELISSDLSNPLSEKFIDIKPSEVEKILERGLTNKDFSEIDKMPIEEIVQLLPSSFYLEMYAPSILKTRGLMEQGALQGEMRQAKIDNSVKNFSDGLSAGHVEVFDRSSDIPVPQEGKKPICIVGFLAREWKQLDQTQKEAIAEQTIKLVSSINPNKAYIVTEMSPSGFNEMLHEIILKVNPKLYTLGIIDENQIDSTGPEQQSWSIEHCNGVKIEQKNPFIYSLSLAKFLKEHDGKLVSFGEGSHNKDHITNMHNLGGNLHVFSTKSSTKSHLFTDLIFEDAKDVLDSQIEQEPSIKSEEVTELVRKLTLHEKISTQKTLEKGEKSNG